MIMKNTVKRILSVFSCMALMFALPACGAKEPTAEGLLAGVSFDPDRLTSASVTCRVTSDMPEDLDGIDEGFSVPAMNGDVTLTADVDVQGGILHVSGLQADISVEGMSLGIGADLWLDQPGGKGYVRVDMLGQDMGWMESDTGSLDGMPYTGQSGIADVFDGLVRNGSGAHIMDRGKKDDYTVRWTVPGDALNDLADGAVPSDLDVQAVFAYDGHGLQALYIEGASETGAMSMEALFYAVNAEGSLSIPQDVIDSAGSADLSGIFGGMDAGFSYDGTDGPSGPSASAVDTDQYKNDGEGYDDVLDPLAQQLSGSLQGHDTVAVWHFSDHTELCFEHDSPDGSWSGSSELHRYPDDPDGAAGFFADQKAFYSDWYSIEPYFESDSEVLYLTDSGELALCRILSDGTMAVSADVFSYGTFDDSMTLSRLSDMLALTGLQP